MERRIIELLESNDIDLINMALNLIYNNSIYTDKIKTHISKRIKYRSTFSYVLQLERDDKHHTISYTVIPNLNEEIYDKIQEQWEK